MSQDICSFVHYGPKDDQPVNDLITELNQNSRDYTFIPPDRGNLPLLRARARAAHGHDLQKFGDIRTATESSPISLVLSNTDVYISPIYSSSGNESRQCMMTTFGFVESSGSHKISSAEVLEHQQGARVYFEPTKTTIENVLAIQQCKATGNNPSIDDLHRQASYTVVRGEVKQHYDMNGGLLPSPLARVLYYANFPSLAKNSPLLAHFAARKNGAFHLRDDRKAELIQRFKDVILLQAKVAAQNGDFIDILTPNAFFYGLEKTTQQPKVKEWFAEAIVAAIAEIQAKPKIYLNLKGVVFHNTAVGVQQKLETHLSTNPKLPFHVIISNNGDCSAVQKASQKLGLKITGAECIMGEPLGPAGNAALGDRAASAAEENTTRRCALWVQVIFGPQFNKYLLDPKRYIALTPVQAILDNKAEKSAAPKSKSFLTKPSTYIFGLLVAVGIAGLALGIITVSNLVNWPLFAAYITFAVGGICMAATASFAASKMIDYALSLKAASKASNPSELKPAQAQSYLPLATSDSNPNPGDDPHSHNHNTEQRSDKTSSKRR